MTRFNTTSPLSPAQAFAHGYEAGDRVRHEGAADAPKALPPKAPDIFGEEWERGYRAGLRGELAPTITS